MPLVSSRAARTLPIPLHNAPSRRPRVSRGARRSPRLGARPRRSPPPSARGTSPSRPPGSTEVFDRGRLVVPQTGQTGSFGLEGQGFTGDLVSATLTASGNAFTLAATLSVAGQALPLTVTGTVSGDTFAGTLQAAGQPELPIAGTRVDPNAPVAAAPAAPRARPPNAALFATLPLPAPSRVPHGRRPPRTRPTGRTGPTTASAPRSTRRRNTHHGHGHAALHQQQPRGAAVPLDAAGPEPVPTRPAAASAPTRARATPARPTVGEGYRLGTVTVGGTAVTPIVTDTRMRIDLPTPVAGERRPRRGHGPLLVRRPAGGIGPDGPPRDAARHGLLASRSGTRAPPSTTTSTAGTRCRTSARASSTSTTATSISRSPSRPR